MQERGLGAAEVRQALHRFGLADDEPPRQSRRGTRAQQAKLRWLGRCLQDVRPGRHRTLRAPRR
jgi:hypothetical protein